MQRDANFWVEKLGLIAHPEGGYFKETYRADGAIKIGPPFSGERSYSTAIYFLLKRGQVSKLHRIKSDEMWHFYSGSSVTISAIESDGSLKKYLLGPDYEKGERFQVMIKAGAWFGASVNAVQGDKLAYSLVGCTVAPGFAFEDFEMGDRGKLLGEYPKLKEVIEVLT